MTIKQNGGVFGRNPTFNDVTIDGDLTVEGTVIHTGDLTVDNINISGNVISSTNTNGNIDLNANGTGVVEINKPATAGIVTGIRMINPQNAPGTGDGTNIVFQNTGDSGRRSEIQGYSNNNYGLDNGLRFLTQDGSSTPRTVLDLRGGAAGDVKVSIGNLVIGTSGKGIDFSATAGTGTSELFDDYEEGDWTPVVADAVTGGNVATLSVSNGYYTKVGDLVHVQAKITLSSKGSMSAGNPIYIRSLPFTSKNSTNGATTFSILCNGVTTIGNYVTSLMDENATTFRLFDSGSGVNFIVVSEITDTTQFVIGGTYRAA
jgi:hypothetical protein